MKLVSVGNTDSRLISIHDECYRSGLRPTFAPEANHIVWLRIRTDWQTVPLYFVGRLVSLHWLVWNI